MPSDVASPGPEGPIAVLAVRTRADVAAIERELAEIDMLVSQATSEAARHEAKRAAAAEKLAGLGDRGDARTEVEAGAQLLQLTRRAAVMDAQVDVLAGKLKALRRHRDALEAIALELAALAGLGDEVLTELAVPPPGDARPRPTTPVAIRRGGDVEPLEAARIVLGAQEDLRREIARSLHDGPAQSLTNIVLQAQIVDRLMSRDAEAAGAELRSLVTMVGATLDATKAFIFDVRPMVLDDLGLVPTLRRAAQERSRRAGVPVEFDSAGADRRLSTELESGLFRILDEALAGFLAGRPDRVVLRLDWGEALGGGVEAVRSRAVETRDAAAPSKKKGRFGRTHDAAAEEELLPALAAMIEDRRVAEALSAAPAPLPVNVWREIQDRAATIGVTVELSGDGSALSFLAAVPPVA